MGYQPLPPKKERRGKVQPKDEPRWAGHPEMEPTEPQDFPQQGGSGIFPVKYRSPVIPAPRVDHRLLGKEYR